MNVSTRQRSVRSLADMRSGEDAEIGDIAFETIREQCPALGLRVGTVVHCAESRGRELVLQTPEGQELAVDRFYAAFIEVRPVRLVHR